jgi:anti-sigma factor RsiW
MAFRQPDSDRRRDGGGRSRPRYAISSEFALPVASCEQAALRLTDYLERALVPPDQRRLESHLAECPACRTLLHELRMTVSLLGRLSTRNIQK